MSLTETGSCTRGHECNIGEGDCNHHIDCAKGLRCVHDVGARYGYAHEVNVCLPKEAKHAPVVDVAFPPPHSMTDKDTVTVRGTASDKDGVAAVYVNGVLATTTDGYATWAATVPVGFGASTLDVETVDTTGRVDPLAARLSIKRELQLSAAVGVAVDPARNRAYSVESYSGRVVAFDLATGDAAIASAPERGSGPALQRPTAIAMDPMYDRILILDYPRKALIAVDPDTGDRTILSGSDSPGPAFLNPQALAVDPARNQVLVSNADFSSGYAGDAVLAVDLDSGARSTLSSNDIGTGPMFPSPTALAMDVSRDRILVTDLRINALIAVDPDTGDRTILSNAAHGTGSSLNRPLSMTLDPARNRALIGERWYLRAVDLDTGDRTPLAFAGDIRGLAVDAARNRVVLADRFHPYLIGVDLDRLKMTDITRMSNGAGPAFYRPSAGVLDRENNRALILDRATVIAVDLLSGDRSILSSRDVGMGPAPYMYRGGAVLDQARGRLLTAAYLGDEVHVLLAIDLASGDRSVLATLTSPDEPELEDAHGLAVDFARNLAYYVDEESEVLLSVDLDTGTRRIVSGLGVGSGPELGEPITVVVDTVHDRLLVSNEDVPMIAVDPITGDRSVFGDDDDDDEGSYSGLLLDPAHNRLLVADRSEDRLIAFDLDTGVGTELSASKIGQGPRLDRPYAVLFDTHGDRVLMVDYKLQALVSVHLDSGDRIILSR